MRYVTRGDERELITADGRVVVWPVQLAILQGLLDRPNGIALSRKDCACSGLPYYHPDCQRDRMYRRLYEAIPRLVERGWVRRNRAGRRIMIGLSSRGHSLVDGDVAVLLIGRGTWVPRSRRVAV